MKLKKVVKFFGDTDSYEIFMTNNHDKYSWCSYSRYLVNPISKKMGFAFCKVNY